MEVEYQKKDNLNKLNTYKENFKNSFEEIKLDIERENAQLFNQKKSLTNHLENLYRDLNVDIARTYMGLKKKMNSPVSFLDDNRCGQCKTQLDVISIKNIEHFNEIVTCPTCKRILISTGIQY